MKSLIFSLITGKQELIICHVDDTLSPVTFKHVFGHWFLILFMLTGVPGYDLRMAMRGNKRCRGSTPEGHLNET